MWVHLNVRFFEKSAYTGDRKSTCTPTPILTYRAYRRRNSAPLPTDEELMHLVQTGDGQAYQLLFTRYKDPVWSYIFRRVRDQQTASDLYQKVFLRVWRFAKSLNRIKSASVGVSYRLECD